MTADPRTHGVGAGDLVDVVVRGRVHRVGQLSMTLEVPVDAAMSPPGVRTVEVWIPAEGIRAAVLAVPDPAPGAPHDPCASCGTSRGEHAIAQHAFTEDRGGSGIGDRAGVRTAGLRRRRRDPDRLRDTMTPPRQRTAPVEPDVDEDALAERAAAAVREKLIADARATYAGPGVYDWPADAYHADPVPGGSARSTTLRTILKAGGPALVEWERLHPKHSDAFDFGGAAHRYVLGKGDDVVEVPCDSWRTNAAKDARRDARRRGARPLLTAEILKAHALADQVLAHEVAGPLFRSSIPERTAVWGDDETGETCRVMVDAFPNLDLPGRPVAGDLKTTGSVEMRKLIRTILDYGYDQQGAWVLDGLASLGVVDAEFWLVFVTKDPPHLVRTVRLPDELLERGRRRNRRALTRWAFCRDTGAWPALPPVIDDPDVPSWLAYEQEED